MGRRKQSWVNELVDGMTISGVLFNPTFLLILVTAATVVIANQLWEQHRSIIVDLENFRLTEEKLKINDPPPWGERNLNEWLLSELSADQAATLLEPSLIKQTLSVFKQVGWVEDVKKIEKTRAGLDIELQYRIPVAVVELDRNNVKAWPLKKPPRLFPVDRSGMIMPDELAIDIPLLRLTIFEPGRFTHLDTWTPWPDERILEGCRIADFFAQHWRSLGLYRITTLRLPDQPFDAEVPFELWTDRAAATKIVWGNPPGKEAPGEAKAEQKLQLLFELQAKYGPLNQLPAVKIDIRTGTPVTLSGQIAGIAFSADAEESLN